MHRIFISYRRTDTEHVAGRLADDLRDHFGEDVVFRDKESIPIGADWAREIRKVIGSRGVVLVLIGERWLEPGPDGRRRIESADDTHRGEIAAALQLDCTVVPVLVGNTVMPGREALPPDLQRLTQLNAVKLRDDEWKALDFPRLVKFLESSGFQPNAESAKRSAPGRGWSGLGIASLVIGLLAGAGVAVSEDQDSYVGSAFIGMLALALGIFAVREVRKNRVRNMRLAVGSILLSGLTVLFGFAGAVVTQIEHGLDALTTPASTAAPAQGAGGTASPGSASPGGQAAAPSIPATRDRNTVTPREPTVVDPPADRSFTDLTGTWRHASDGLVNIVQTGTDVLMVFPQLQLTLAGTAVGRELQAGALTAAGPLVLHLALMPDGRSLVGTLTLPNQAQDYELFREGAAPGDND